MMNGMRDFDGLVAPVTGGGSGIGAATADLLADRGARVAVLDRATQDACSRHLALCCDITDRSAVDRAVADVVAAFGGFDVVINNAGISAQRNVSANADEEWLQVLDVNVVGIARVSSAALPHLRRTAYGAIVNTCSVLAVVGVPNRALYSATKGAVLALTLAMAADHIADGVRVNCVMPGTTDTPWVMRLTN
jgi:2-keto-3-deoxy-L-fuconate dehydrogenase